MDRNPENNAFREEVARIADACYRAGKYPHRRYFPDVDERCIHTGNALLVAIDSIWIEAENKRHAERYPSTPEQKQPTPEEDAQSPVVIVNE